MDGNFERVNIIFLKIITHIDHDHPGNKSYQNLGRWDNNILRRTEGKKKFRWKYTMCIKYMKIILCHEFYRKKMTNNSFILLVVRVNTVSIIFRGNEADWIVRETWDIARQDHGDPPVIYFVKSRSLDHRTVSRSIFRPENSPSAYDKRAIAYSSRRKCCPFGITQPHYAALVT